MKKLKQISRELRASANKKQAKLYQRFFKTGPGEYGEGDIFIGVNVPQTRMFAKKYQNLSFPETVQLLKSKIHEERMLALMIFILKFQKGNEAVQREIYETYLQHTRFINNWDLVDLSAYKIVGPYLERRNRKILNKLAVSKSLWERRIAIVSTMHFIRANEFKETCAIAKRLLKDKQDLIHKAAGWLLREVGKRDVKTMEEFLNQHHRIMPRTMLRYAIEKLPYEKRLIYMKTKKDPCVIRG